MQFFDVLPQTATASVITTEKNVIINIPTDLAELAGFKPSDHLQLRYGAEGETKAIQLVKSDRPSVWKVIKRRAVCQIYAKQILPKQQFSKTKLVHELQSGALILTLPTSWDLKDPDIVSTVAPRPASAPKGRSK